MIHMKRVLNLRNTVVFSLGLVGLLFLTSSFTFGPTEDAQLVGNDPQKKEKRVKVIVRVDGNETKIDTAFNIPDEKIANEKIDSILSKIDGEGTGHHRPGHVLIMNDKMMKFHHRAMNNSPADEQFNILIQDNDSGKLCKAKKVICIKTDDDDQMIEEIDDDQMFPPPPPMPCCAPSMYHHSFGSDPFAFDTKDESVVSYEKKDIGNGLEKITIIRKKQGQDEPQKVVHVKAIVSDDSLIKKKEDERKVLKKLKDEADASKSDKK